MAQTVTFDIYVRKEDRWQHYDKFIEQERDDAIQTAEKLDHESGVNGVRIIRVTAFGTNRAPIETLEWISPALKKNPSRTPVKSRSSTKSESSSSGAGQSVEASTSEAARERRQKAKSQIKTRLGKSNSRPLLLKQILIPLLCGALAIALYVPATHLVGSFDPSGTRMPPLFLALIAFSLCALVFTLLTGAGFYILLDWERAPLPKRDKTASSLSPEQAPIDPTSLSDDSPEQPLQEESPLPQIPFIPSNNEEEVPLAGNETFELQDIDQKTENAPIPTGPDQEYRLQMLRFLERSLSELAEILKTVDLYSLFGINLFLGGAGDRFGAHKKLSGIQRFILIRETISALGTQDDMVDVFCEKFRAYDKDPKYHFMTEAGRRLMDGFLNEDPNCFQALPELIKLWRRSDAAIAQAQGVIVIMFTDLVGSTQMTQKHGDHGAQEVVRAHNAIVRNALAHYHGEEVKHTGDGIMASFSNAPNAVRATIDIQRDIAKHNSANPDLPVRVRIGLNAGDAVREEDDFFGQTVQLSARICDKADEGEIYITPSVYEFCSGHTFTITEAGVYELKGIDVPVQAYAVAWQDEAAAEKPSA